MRAPSCALVFSMVLLCVSPCATAQSGEARARSVYARAVELEARGNYSAALPLLWEAADLSPHSPDIQNRLGEALDRIGALDAAIDAFDQALAARPGFSKAASNLILTLVKAGRGPEAVERARARAAAAPRDADALFTLGLAQSEQDFEASIATFRRVLDLAPGHALARHNLALVLKRADRTAEAIDELRKAIRTEASPQSYYTLGVIYWQLGDLQRAVHELREAIARQPAYADAYYALGAVLKLRRDWNGAAAALGRAVELQPELPGARYTLGQVLQLAGRRAEAEKQLDEAERLRKRAALLQEAAVWTAVGARKLDAGDALGALDCFRRATTVLDVYAPAHYQTGRALARLGQPDAARSAFARAQQLNPSLVPPD